jgi:MFS family permease
MVIISLFVWSVMTCLTGCVHTFHQMAWARAFMGISEAFYIPAALALIADFHAGPTRSRAVGIHMAGIYAGQALGGVGGYIADAGSWRNAFYWFGAAGVIYAVFLMLFLKESGARESASVHNKGVSLGSVARGLFGVGGFLILVAYFTLPAIPGWAVKNWLPTFLSSAFHLKQGPAGMSATGTCSSTSRQMATCAIFGGNCDTRPRTTRSANPFESATASGEGSIPPASSPTSRSIRTK